MNPPRLASTRLLSQFFPITEQTTSTIITIDPTVKAINKKLHSLN